MICIFTFSSNFWALKSFSTFIFSSFWAFLIFFYGNRYALLWHCVSFDLILLLYPCWIYMFFLLDLWSFFSAPNITWILHILCSFLELNVLYHAFVIWIESQSYLPMHILCHDVIWIAKSLVRSSRSGFSIHGGLSCGILFVFQ